MNIIDTKAGCVKHEHFISSGFVVFDTWIGNDMGQSEWEIPQYTNGKVKIVGGFWEWSVTSMDDSLLWKGWWNTNEEFDQTIKELYIKFDLY